MKLTNSQRNDFQVLYNYLRVDSKLPFSADAIVVGGSGTRTDMADRAAELYAQKKAPVIVFSGFAHPDYGTNEAELLAHRAIELGVPEKAIIKEPHATNTGLNIILAAKALDEHGIHPSTVILVHKPFMTRRFMATGEMQWPDPRPKFYVTSANYDFASYMALEEERGFEQKSLARLLADYRALKEFPALGFTSSQIFEENVELAYKRLLSQGFKATVPNHAHSSDLFLN